MKPTIYYADEAVTLWHGRCEDVLPTLPAQSIDAVICDLPFGTTACAWDTPIDFGFMWRELKRLTKRNAAIVLFGSQPFTSALVMSNVKMFKWEDVWDKVLPAGFLNAKKQPLRRHENVLVFGDGPVTYNPQMQFCPDIRSKPRNGKVYGDTESAYGVRVAVSGDYTDRYPTSIVQFTNANQTAKVHPTQKPLALLEYLILTYTNPGDTVLDFTSGSGTTPVAAKKLGRKCVAIESELEYCEVTVPRLYQEVMDLSVSPPQEQR